jgi:hypothetical protein
MSFSDASKKAELLAEGLDEIAAIAGGSLGLSEFTRDLRTRADTIRADRFRIVVVGGFDRGKSTLLNAMLGCDILPQALVPSTAVITVIEYGAQPGALVQYADGMREQLSVDELRSRYVLKEADISDGQLVEDRFSKVEYAIISYPIELCRQRVELVDSPGLQDDPIRTARTERFLNKADAAVMVLDATQLLQEEERHFIETRLLPRGLRDIFFIVNRWNMVPQMIDGEEKLAQEIQEIRSRMLRYLKDLQKKLDADDAEASAERIFAERTFWVDALGAKKGRLRKPPSTALVEESNVPAFERALERFLVEDRGRARDDVVLADLEATEQEVDRAIATQIKMADKSIAAIEEDRKAIQPKLNRLRDIKKDIEDFLDNRSSELRERLVLSLQAHIQKITAKGEVEREVDQFNLTPITEKTIVLEVIKDLLPGRAEEDKLAKQVERCLKPQVQRMLERRFAEWHTAVVQNEMKVVEQVVEKHLQKDAADYQRVMEEIEQKIGIHTNPLEIEELVKHWLSGEEGSSTGKFEVSNAGLIGDVMIPIVGGIVLDVVAQVMLHLAAAVWLPFVGIIIAAIRMVFRERELRQEIRERIVEAVRQGLNDAGRAQASRIREQVRAGFDGLKQRIGGKIDEEIVLIDASLQAIIDRKKQAEFDSEQERSRLEAARAAVDVIVSRLRAMLPASVRTAPS